MSTNAATDDLAEADFASMTTPPALVDVIPDLARFVDDLAAQHVADNLADHDDFVGRCRSFYTDEMLAVIDRSITGWTAMASYLDGQTLWHTTAAMMSLRTLDEYRNAPTSARDLMDWAVLLHDLAKQPTGRGRDHPHGFRSAAAAGRVLPQIGFDVREEWRAGFDEWFSVADSAYRHDNDEHEYVQDNHHLPTIIGGADRLYGADAAIVLKAIALHLSVTVVADWPARSPLTRDEERAFIDSSSKPVLLATMLADHGGWNAFDGTKLAHFNQQTRDVFVRL